MDVLCMLAGTYGLWLLWSRWPSMNAPGSVAEPPTGWPSVSIVVPARDEALTLPTLLPSLVRLDYPDFEIIVVDDGSTDGTAAVARRYGGERVKVVAAGPRPADWRGKQWACQEGARHAKGKIVLFTDADTDHTRESLRYAVGALIARGGGLISCLPHHAGTSTWERLTGPFHVLMLTTTRPLGRQSVKRTFAIGQYLMFDRVAYEQVGGHEAVKAAIVEDLPLAQACLRSEVPYHVYGDATPLFRVRMYPTLGEFVRGWRRNVRAGLGSTTPLAPIEVTAMIVALAGAGLDGMFGAGAAVIGMGLMVRAQRRLGDFSVAGAVLWPFAVALFSYATLLAVWDMIAGKPVQWKGRTYPSGT